MRIFPLVSLIIAIAACTEKKTDQKEAPPKVIMKEVLVTSQNCDPDSSNCSYVRIEYPMFNDSARSKLNLVLASKLKAVASDFFREEVLGETFEHIARSFILDFETFKIDFPEYKFRWYTELLAEIIYESESLISFRIDTEAFTGGAHPNSSTNYFVVDANTGRRFTIADMISDTVRFKKLLEIEFRKVKGMGENQTFADRGYYINDGDFLLNENMGLTDQHVIVHFNPYEIAPYSEGATTLELKKEDLVDLLKIP